MKTDKKIQVYVTDETKKKVEHKAKQEKRSVSQMAGVIIANATKDIKLPD